MKIKTICNDISDADEFDRAVNAALAEGWELKKTDTLPGVGAGSTFFRPLLIAELVLEPCCDNCKHEACDPDDPSTPCYRCKHDDQWEARGS